MSPSASRPIGLIVLGSTGSVGRQTLEVAARHASRIRVLGLVAGRNGALLARQVAEHRPLFAGVVDERSAELFRAELAGPWDGELLVGPEAAQTLAAWPGAGVVVNALVGATGLAASLAVLERGARLALANKESLVVAGHLLRRALREHGGELLPIDSEHSALFQCLAGLPRAAVRRVILTASGGPFRTLDSARLADVTPEEALRHPTWSMGARISIDSATLFNKGLEVIEARWLFDLDLETIDVWIHPQSIVHALVESCDGSLLAQLSRPDMRLPIQLALSHPERWEAVVAGCDLPGIGGLDFEPLDESRYPCLAVARRAARLGGIAPAAVNAADEVLVVAFLERRIAFTAIASGIAAVLDECRAEADPDLARVLEADRWARQRATAWIAERPGGGAAR